MEVFHNLAFGFEHALTWQNLLFCAIGCTVGTLVGLLPGLGPLATISILLPLTYSIPTGGALIMLAGIYYGAQYGDSVSAITMKIPHASSIVACIDGYQMTLNGKTGLALFTAGASSFIGGGGRDAGLGRRPPAARGVPGALRAGRPPGPPLLRPFFVVARPDPGAGRAPVRAGRLLRAHALRLLLREPDHHRKPAERPRHVPDRRAARADRHRSRERRPALHVRPAVARRGRQPRQRGAW